MKHNQFFNDRRGAGVTSFVDLEDKPRIPAPSYLVAASNAPDDVKDAADFVCDGDDDQEEIQNALDGAKESGAVVQLSPGEFYTTEALTVGSGKVRIVGAGMFASVIKPEYDEVGRVIDIDGSSSDPLESLELYDFAIDMTEVPGSGNFAIHVEHVHHSHLERVRGLHTPGSFCRFRNGIKDSSVIGCRLHDIGRGENIGYGFQWMPSTSSDPVIERVVASNNIVDGNGRNALAVYGNTDYVSITGNVLRGYPGQAHSAIGLSAGRHVSVTGNVCYDVTRSSECGIEIEGHGGHSNDPSICEYIAVSGNTVYNCDEGIKIVAAQDGDGSRYATITGNLIHDVGEEAVVVSSSQGVVVSANTIKSPGANGVRVRASLNVVVCNNATEDCGSSDIWVRDAKAVTVLGCHMVHGQGPGGLFVNEDSEDIRILDNLVYEPSGRGMRFDDTSALLVKGNRIVRAQDEGIRLAGDNTYTRISFNEIIRASQGSDHSSNAIWARDGFEDLIVESNFIDAGDESPRTRRAVQVPSGTTGVIIRDNTLTGEFDEKIGQINDQIVYDNKGLKTRNKGDATVPDGSTSVVVTHDLEQTPDITSIFVTPSNDLGSASKFWISGVGSSEFTINVDADPGSDEATFAWVADTKKVVN